MSLNNTYQAMVIDAPALAPPASLAIIAQHLLGLDVQQLDLEIGMGNEFWKADEFVKKVLWSSALWRFAPAYPGVLVSLDPNNPFFSSDGVD